MLYNNMYAGIVFSIQQNMLQAIFINSF